MTSRKRRQLLEIEALEDRRVPATWGIPWADPQHLTVSFVPDGTSVQGQSSSLFQTLNTQLGTGNWQTPILKALQTWAVNSNINIGLVADGGEPVGTPGPAQGDARFGDIRISAEPLPSDVVAITSPYNPSYGSLSGDMILNSNDNFTPGAAGAYDLFTVALHEAGHVFGFADSSDPSSFMYNVYQGPQTGLASGAVPALQALYGGARNINSIDGNPISSNSLNPVTIPNPSGNSTSVTMAGDLSSTQSVDYFTLKGSSNLLNSLLGEDIRIQTTGISLLTPKVTVYDAFGNVVASASATSPLSGGVSVHLAGLFSFENYTIRVQGATGDVLSVGSYAITVSPSVALWNPSNPTAGSQGISGSSNNGSTPLTATATISQINQNDVYSVKTPSSTSNGLTVNIQDWGIGLLAPAVTVYDALGDIVGSATSTSSTAQSLSLTVPIVLPNATYYVSVQNSKINQEAFGSYQVALSFTPPSSSTGTSALATPWFGSNNAWNGQTNNTLNTAATLQTPAGDAAQSRYLAIEGINSTQAQQFYQVNTPKAASGQTTEVMTVSVEALGSSGLLPWINVFDQNGNAVSSQPLVEQDGVAVVQVLVPTSGSRYYVEVSASQTPGSLSSGNFYLEATFGNIVGAIGPIASGTLAAAPAGSPTAPVATTLTVGQGELYSFVLSGATTNTGTDAIIQMSLVDSSGNIDATLSTPASLAQSMTILLPAGNYTVLIDAYSPSGQPIPTLEYSLMGTSLTDPIKAYVATGSGGASNGS